MPADAAPAWYRAALAVTPTVGSVEVAGTQVAYSAWGDPTGDDVVLVHGGGANARWWDHIAPLLAEGRRVVALDLSGHGDSERRPVYTLEQWADEVRAVVDASGLGPQPTVIGHSMGGFVSLQAVLQHGDAFAGVVVLDSPVRDMTEEEGAAMQRRAFGPLHCYPSRAAALERFRPVPEQETVLPYVVRHIAEGSVRETRAGWTWKFDPAVFMRPILSPAVLAPIPSRAAAFRAECGRLSRDLAEDMDDRLGGGMLVVVLPAAGHHMMLDQPLALVSALRTLLTAWK